MLAPLLAVVAPVLVPLWPAIALALAFGLSFLAFLPFLPALAIPAMAFAVILVVAPVSIVVPLVAVLLLPPLIIHRLVVLALDELFQIISILLVLVEFI